MKEIISINRKWHFIKKKSFGVCIILVILFSFLSINVYADEPGYQVTRLFGTDRYDTAIKIAEKYSNGASLQNIVLSTGNDFPDALSGGVFAFKMNAPILLTGEGVKESQKTLDYIVSKVDKSGTIYIFGGQGVVSEDIVDYLKTNGFVNFIRLGGKDRFETNTEITTKLNVKTGTPVIIVTASDFPDALSISSFAAIMGHPIIISDSNKLSQSAADLIKTIQPSTVTLIGGESVLSKQIISDLKATLPSLNDGSIVRISGKTRYETSLSISSMLYYSNSSCLLATGTDFPDGITGSVLAAKLNAPILLINDDTLSKQSNYIYANSSIADITILGGLGVVSKNIEQTFLQTLDGFDCAGTRTYADALQLKAAGYSFACRYYFDYDPSVAWKNNLTSKEAKDISKAGLKIVVVYEDGGKDASYFNYKQGVSDCKVAIKNAEEVGQPSDTPIYFAVDYDVAKVDFSNIETYFQAIKDTMQNKWKIGIYGKYDIAEDIYKQLGTDTYVWQCYAWSDGKVLPFFNVYQFQNNVDVGKINIDKDKSNVTRGNNVGGFTVNN